MSILAIYYATNWIRELSGLAPMGILFTITKVGSAISACVQRTLAIAVFMGTDVLRTRPGRRLCGQNSRRGATIDGRKAQAGHGELAGALRNAGVEVYYREDSDPTRHYGVNSRDLTANSPEGVVICRFRYSEPRGEQVAEAGQRRESYRWRRGQT